MVEEDRVLEVALSKEQQSEVIEKIKKVVNNGRYNIDWTYAPGNKKNRSFMEKYICGEDEYRNVINKLSTECFYEAEKNNSPKSRVDAEAAKEIMYKFIIKDNFALRYTDDVEEEYIDVYIKITFPYGSDDSVIIVSFHESLRSLKEELDNKV